MSRYPSCTWRPISGTSRTLLRKDILCLHTMVGYLSSTWNYFDRPDVGVYSHIGVGGPWGADAGKGLDGAAWQMADTDYRAAANLDGNPRVISVETADNAARPIARWTDKQCDTLVRIMVDAHRIDGIPLELIPDSKPGRRGIAYHRLGCDPYRVPGGERWSSSVGKDCPTEARIQQIPGLIARARAIVAGGTPATPQEVDPMAGITIDDIRKVVREEVVSVYNLLAYGDQRVDTLPDTHPENQQRIRDDLDAFRAEAGEVLASISAKVDALADPPAPEPAPPGVTLGG